MLTPLNPGGGQVMACDLDSACEVLSCDVCLTEIPASVAQTMEGEEYVQHFCGLDCMQVWHNKTGGGSVPR